MVLHGIAGYCMVLYGMAWYCMVLYVIEWSWGFNSLLCELCGSYGLIMIALIQSDIALSKETKSWYCCCGVE